MRPDMPSNDVYTVSQSWVPRANHTPVLGVPVVDAPGPFLVGLAR